MIQSFFSDAFCSYSEHRLLNQFSEKGTDAKSWNKTKTEKAQPEKNGEAHKKDEGDKDTEHDRGEHDEDIDHDLDEDGEDLEDDTEERLAHIQTVLARDPRTKTVVMGKHPGKESGKQNSERRNSKGKYAAEKDEADKQWYKDVEPETDTVRRVQQISQRLPQDRQNLPPIIPNNDEPSVRPIPSVREAEAGRNLLRIRNHPLASLMDASDAASSRMHDARLGRLFETVQVDGGEAVRTVPVAETLAAYQVTLAAERDAWQQLGRFWTANPDIRSIMRQREIIITPMLSTNTAPAMPAPQPPAPPANPTGPLNNPNFDELLGPLPDDAIRQIGDDRFDQR